MSPRQGEKGENTLLPNNVGKKSANDKDHNRVTTQTVSSLSPLSMHLTSVFLSKFYMGKG